MMALSSVFQPSSSRWSGTPLAWFDPRGHHLVTFPATLGDPSWADALVALVKDGRARSVEVRKVDGRTVHDPDVANGLVALLEAAGWVVGYRGLVHRG